MPISIEFKHSCMSVFTAHIGNYAVDPLFVVKTFVKLPVNTAFPKMLVVINCQIQKKHFVIWYCRKQCRKGLVVPNITLVTKHPALHNPSSIRVGRLDCVIQIFSIRRYHLIASRVVFWREWYLHFIETVSQIVLTFSKFFFPLLNEHFTYFGEKFILRRQHITVEIICPR